MILTKRDGGILGDFYEKAVLGSGNNGKYPGWLREFSVGDIFSGWSISLNRPARGPGPQPGSRAEYRTSSLPPLEQLYTGRFILLKTC